MIEQEIRQIRTSVERSLQNTAQQRYFVGMLLAILVFGGFAYPLSKWVIPQQYSLTAPVFIAGMIGAVISAATRLSSASLKLDYRTSNWLIVINGAFRPIIGGVFGLAVYIFIAGQILPIKVTAIGRTTETYFYLGVAFLAGFSERFARDAITQAGSVLGSNGGEGSNRDPADTSNHT